MTLVVRNTFLHLEKHPDDETCSLPRASRSSSEPPSFRPIAGGRMDYVQLSDDTSSNCEWYDACSNCEADEPEACSVSDRCCDVTSQSGNSNCADADAWSHCGYETDFEVNTCGYETDTGSDCETMASFPQRTAKDSFETGDLGWAPKTKEAPASVDTQAGEVACKREVTQQQLEEMSQTVMGMWSALSALEASIAERSAPSATTLFAPKSEPKPLAPTMLLPDLAPSLTEQAVEKQPLRLAPFLGIDDEPTSKTPLRRPAKSGSGRLDSRARLFTPKAKLNVEIEHILVHASHVLNSTMGVAATDITQGAAGTMLTLSVKLKPPVSWESTCLSVISIAKAALLESTSRSTQVYVLGYEASPFEDNSKGTGFTAALAIMPATWQCTACWETYRQGFCPRSTTCRWQHPGRDEIQPIRVLLL